MFKSVAYVLRENFTNIYRIFSIARYELLADMRDSKFGLIWNFLSPAIQVLTYWLVFGIGMSRGQQQGIDYMPWVVVGFAAWWFIGPCLQQGCSAVFSKTNVITKMKFPVSVLPATVILKELFNHLCMMIIALVVIMMYGFYPNIYWLGVIYYMICAVILMEAIAMITSVLTMIWRDIKKLVVSLMRMLMYVSPVLWTAKFDNIPALNYIMRLNPFYYIIQGYRDVLLFEKSIFAHPGMTVYFWTVVVILFVAGCMLMYRFKRKFIDMI